MRISAGRLVLGALIGAIGSTSARASECGDLRAPIRPGDVPCLTNELINHHFPELDTAWRQGRIRFREFDSNAYYLKTSFSAGRLSRDPSQREYSIDVNPGIYDVAQTPSGPPSVAAIQGILAHELWHLVDYETSSVIGILRLGTDLLLHPARVERRTDLRAFARGFAESIKAYRVWIYGKLSPRQMRVKRARYFTPEEIDDWCSRHPGCFPPGTSFE
ncbi:MAG: hypothetical protein JST04_15845 [Bdellovibrionales bacterium]|nr:hypothetical protein [Bdellovibrionales bacterium]